MVKQSVQNLYLLVNWSPKQKITPRKSFKPFDYAKKQCTLDAEYNIITLTKMSTVYKYNTVAYSNDIQNFYAL